MTVVLDENFPKRIIPILEYRGISVVDIRSTNDEGMSDQSLFEMAQSLEASIFTTDRDFLTMVHRNNSVHSGILIVTLGKPNSESIIRETINFLDRIPPATWAHHCYVLTGSGSCRVYG
jgi:predicted nuclease of predicted toxin-antitoxin system